MYIIANWGLMRSPNWPSQCTGHTTPACEIEKEKIKRGEEGRCREGED
jgi:hypothetical protein